MNFSRMRTTKRVEPQSMKIHIEHFYFPSFLDLKLCEKSSLNMKISRISSRMNRFEQNNQYDSFLKYSENTTRCIKNAENDWKYL